MRLQVLAWCLVPILSINLNFSKRQAFDQLNLFAAQSSSRLLEVVSMGFRGIILLVSRATKTAPAEQPEEGQNYKGTCPKCHLRVEKLSRHMWEAHKSVPQPAY